MARGAASSRDEVHVLLVEDDVSVAEMYKLKLELDGYKVVVASDGEVALDLARAGPPDLIFLDIRLPKLDGFEVLEALRADARTSQIPVVILSNYSEADLVERGLKLGAREHLIKSQTTPAKVSLRISDWLKT